MESACRPPHRPCSAPHRHRHVNRRRRASDKACPGCTQGVANAGWSAPPPKVRQDRRGVRCCQSRARPVVARPPRVADRSTGNRAAHRHALRPADLPPRPVRRAPQQTDDPTYIHGAFPCQRSLARSLLCFRLATVDDSASRLDPRFSRDMFRNVGKHARNVAANYCTTPPDLFSDRPLSTSRGGWPDRPLVTLRRPTPGIRPDKYGVILKCPPDRPNDRV